MLSKLGLKHAFKISGTVDLDPTKPDLLCREQKWLGMTRTYQKTQTREEHPGTPKHLRTSTKHLRPLPLSTQCGRSSTYGYSSTFPAHGTMDGRAWGKPGRNTNPAHFHGQMRHGREPGSFPRIPAVRGAAHPAPPLSQERELCGGRPAEGTCTLPIAGNAAPGMPCPERLPGHGAPKAHGSGGPRCCPRSPPHPLRAARSPPALSAGNVGNRAAKMPQPIVSFGALGAPARSGCPARARVGP